MTTKPISNKDYQNVMAKINGLESLIQGWDIEGFAIRIGVYLFKTCGRMLADPGRKRLGRLHRMAYHLKKFQRLAKKDIEIMEAINAKS